MRGAISDGRPYRDNPAYLVILVVLGFGEAWTLVALALDLREQIANRQNPMGGQRA